MLAIIERYHATAEIILESSNAASSSSIEPLIQPLFDRISTLEQQLKEMKNPSIPNSAEITSSTIENLFQPIYDKFSTLEATISRLQDKPLNSIVSDPDSLKKLAGQVSDLAITVATLIEWKDDIEAERSRSL